MLLSSDTHYEHTTRMARRTEVQDIDRTYATVRPVSLIYQRSGNRREAWKTRSISTVSPLIRYGTIYRVL